MIVVVGGGISGLAAARRLAGHDRVLLLEASSRFGGKIAGVDLGGVTVDAGAEAVLARRPEALSLMESLGLQVARPTSATAGLLIEGRRVALPPSRQGIPIDTGVLGDLLSPAGLARAAREPELPAPPLPGDVSIGDYVDERFGPEVTDRLVEPLLGGVYAGDSRRLSFAAVNPGLFERARRGGSLLQAARDLPAPPSAGPVFAGLAGGLSGLIAVLVDDLGRRGVELRSGTTVAALQRAGSGFELTVAPAGGRIRADAVVLAVPAAAAGRLLGELVPTSTTWARIPYASTAVVSVVVRGVEPDGSGILVPPGQLPTIKAATYSSNKWDWVRDAATRHWEAGTHVLRFSVGRRGEEALLQLDDASLLARTVAEARSGLPGWTHAELVTGRVTRWGGGLPQYEVGHRELVARLRTDLDRVPGLAVAGAALDGVGVAPCIASSAAAAEKVLTHLAG